VFIVATITVVAFVVIELFLRLALFQCHMPEPNLCKFGVVKYFFNKTEGAGDLAPNQNGIWAIWPHRPYHVQTNSDGLRNVEELSDDTDFVILAVGDSFTFGPYVPNEDTWPAQLERQLEVNLYPDVTTQVMNAGVAGYTIVDQFHYLNERGIGIKPDLVIIGFFPNDISDMSGLEREYLARPVKQIYEKPYQRIVRSFITDFENKVAILRLAHNIKSSMVQSSVEISQVASEPDDGNCDPFMLPSSTSDDGDCWESYQYWFTNVVNLLEMHKIPLLYVAIPDYRQLAEIGYSNYPQKFAFQLSVQNNIGFVDALPELQRYLDVDSAYLMEFNPSDVTKKLDQYSGNNHMSTQGYRVLADVIAQYILDNDMYTKMKD
tara:strand:- start:6284 stop:7414 length:1131 start_codon:yes stop_codon:yes gene_type:complete